MPSVFEMFTVNSLDTLPAPRMDAIIVISIVSPAASSPLIISASEGV